MLVPKDQEPIGEGRFPDGTPGAPFYYRRSEVDKIRDFGPEWKLEDARFIEEAIQEPDVIFEGLCRPNHEAGLCYSVRPTVDPEDPDSTGPICFDRVFVVFVERAHGFVVFDWEWRHEDPNCPGHPEHWQDDFERPTWRNL